jgi:hypothetical protein
VKTPLFHGDELHRDFAFESEWRCLWRVELIVGGSLAMEFVDEIFRFVISAVIRELSFTAFRLQRLQF